MEIDDVSHFIFNNDLILLQIFSYLPIKYLNKSATVCKRWKYLIDEVKYCRHKNISITLFRGSNWIYSNNQNKDIVISEKDFINNFKNDLNNLLVQPNICIHFLSRSFYENIRCIIKDFNRQPLNDTEIIRRKNLYYITNLISSFLPENSIQLMTTNEGIIGNDLKNYIEKHRDEIKITTFNQIIELKNPEYTGTINGLLIPKNTDSYRFDVKQLVNDSDKLLGVHNERDLLDFFGVQSNESLRFIFIFVNDYYGRLDITLLKFLDVLNIIRNLNEYTGLVNFVVCGCSCHYAFIKNSEKDYNCDEEITFMTLISKNDFTDSVKIVQVTVPGVDEDEEEDLFYPGVDVVLKEKLNLLKNTNITNVDPNERHLFAFHSTSRNSRVHGEIDEESQVFRQMFPQIPLVGFINRSQISHDYFPIAESDFEKNNKNSNNFSHTEYDIVYHRFSDAWETNIDCSTFTVFSLKKFD